MTIANAVTALSAVIAAVSFVSGINAWKREFVGKRRIELAETALALFYEAQDAIQEIRSPFSYVGEGSTRQRGEHESPEESMRLDQAYIVSERYFKRAELFSKLKAKKYEVIVTFGAEAGEPFEEIQRVVAEIRVSAYMLGEYYWRRDRQTWNTVDDFRKYVEEKQKHEAIIWWMGEGNDEITPRVQRAVEKMESVAREASLSKVSRFSTTLSHIRRSSP